MRMFLVLLIAIAMLGCAETGVSDKDVLLNLKEVSKSFVETSLDEALQENPHIEEVCNVSIGDASFYEPITTKKLRKRSDKTVGIYVPVYLECVDGSNEQLDIIVSFRVIFDVEDIEDSYEYIGVKGYLGKTLVFSH